MADDSLPWGRLAGRAPEDTVEQLCLTNVVQQLEHLRAHDSVARALEEGALELHGMYFHVGEAEAYLLTETDDGGVFDRVGRRICRREPGAARCGPRRLRGPRRVGWRRAHPVVRQGHAPCHPVRGVHPIACAVPVARRMGDTALHSAELSLVGVRGYG